MIFCTLLAKDTDPFNNTVQYRPSEKEIVFGLKVPSSDGFQLNFMIKIGKKCFNELCRPKKDQNKAWKVGGFSFLLSKNRKNFKEKPQEAVMHT
jgi:hypothetical protein